jgi:uncharacterized protein
MDEQSSDPKRFELPLFFGLSLLISWAVWVPQALAQLGYGGTAIGLDSPLMLLAVWGPGLAALIVAFVSRRTAGWRELLRPLRRWRVGWGWYALVLLFPAAVWALGRGIDALLGRSYALESPAAAFGAQAAVMLPALILFALPNTLGEELGWRGFALPRLLEARTPLIASVLLGLFWGVWHIPTWIAQGLADEPAGLLLLVVGIVPLTIIYTWIYNGTAGSLLLVWLFHAADTVTQYLLPRLPTLTDDALVWLAALLVIGGRWSVVGGGRSAQRIKAKG